jgi:hypothetical protein
LEICVYSTAVPLPAAHTTVEPHFRKGPRMEGMIRYKWEAGLPFLGHAHGGACLQQVYCAPLSTDQEHLEVTFTDDVIFRSDKKDTFQLVVLLKSLAELDERREALSEVDELPGRFVLDLEATFIIETAEVKAELSGIGNGVFRLATAEEFASSELCNRRPPPKNYDMYQIRKDLGGKTFIIVRPDRFIYAACDTVEELKTICEGIQKTLGLKE